MRKVMIIACLIVVCIVLLWIVYSKRNEQRAARLKEEQRAAEDTKYAKAYGETNLTILGFYANPGAIHSGQKAQLCYGVNNADNVRIEPPVKDVWPSLSRCVDVTPKKETVYKLIAEDSSGHAKTATTTVRIY
jgi:hypothetical protein